MLTDEKLDITGFSLEPDEELALNTGIVTNIDVVTRYEAESTFRFIDGTISNDASLLNIILSSGEISDLEPENSTYKEYSLTPEFNREVFNYEIEILDYIENMQIAAIATETESRMKLKIPKRDEEGNLVYAEDGKTITYEEKEIQNEIPYEFMLNELGEEDTKLTITVIAEDGKTTNDYELIIKRPYAEIKGSIYMNPMKNKGIYKGNIKVFKTEDINSIIDWSKVGNGKRDTVHEQLLTLNYLSTDTNEDGSYSIYVVPGTYDILLDREGYLDHIITENIVNENEVLDIGKKELYAGDFNKDGVIQLLDLSMLYSVYGIDSTAANFDTKIDVNDDNRIQLLDLSALNSNYEKIRTKE